MRLVPGSCTQARFDVLYCTLQEAVNLIFMPASQWPDTGQANLQGGGRHHGVSAARLSLACTCAGRADTPSTAAQRAISTTCTTSFCPTAAPLPHFPNWSHHSPVHARRVKGDGGGSVLGGRRDLLERRHVLKHGCRGERGRGNEEVCG